MFWFILMFVTPVILTISGIILLLNKKLINFGKILFALGSAAIILFVTFFAVISVAFSSINADFYSIIILISSITVIAVIICALWKVIKKKAVYIPICTVLALCALATLSFWGYNSYIDSIPTVGEKGNLVNTYAPYAPETKAVSPDEESSLKIAEDIPVMDGATALYPIYSAFAKAVYPKEFICDIVQTNKSKTRINYNEYLKCSKTTGAYENIVNCKADIIFAAEPSEKQKAYAAENGVELIYTPIGKEAFVFFVNSKNSIDNITTEQIQKIYSGEITDWSALGVKGMGDIKAFQRNEGSGSQSALIRLMDGKALMNAPKKDVIDGMVGIIQQTADYKNFKNAIGYSFRFYSTEMVADDNIKLLSIDGVYPSTENIENGTYPHASYFYAVTRSDADENTKRLLEWIQGQQGQEIIRKTGYTPINSNF